MASRVAVYTTGLFRRAAKKLFDENDIARISEVLSANPTAGDLMRKTGGARKLRWALPGKGKIGGARVVYYFDMGESVFLITAYAKNVQVDVTPDQRKAITALIRSIKESK